MVTAEAVQSVVYYVTGTWNQRAWQEARTWLQPLMLLPSDLHHQQGRMTQMVLALTYPEPLRTQYLSTQTCADTLCSNRNTLNFKSQLLKTFRKSFIFQSNRNVKQRSSNKCLALVHLVSFKI